MSNYILGLFVNHSSKEFSAAARPVDHSHWTKMIATESNRGFEFHPIARDLTKNQVDAFKACQIAAFMSIGYVMVKREAVY